MITRQDLNMSHLTIHQLSVHIVRKCSSQECGHQLSEKGSLTKHQKLANVSIEYQCEQCVYQAPRKSHLYSHQKSGNSEIKSDLDSSVSDENKVSMSGM
jgi:hypothetical protein